MIYNCRETGCEFSAFNEKTLELHRKEKHNRAATSPQTGTPDGTRIPDGTLDVLKPGVSKPDGTPDVSKNQKAEQAGTPNETRSGKPNNKDHYNFLIELKGKKVAVEGINGKTISGVLKRYNQYELNIDTKDGNCTLFKHALFSIRETEQQQPEAIRADEVV